MQAIGIDIWNGNSAQVQIYVARGVTYPIGMNGGAYGARWGFFRNDRHSFAVVDAQGIIQYISSNSIGYIGRYEASKADIIATIERLLMTSGVERVDDRTPSSFVLSQNYPNPFRDETAITFHLPQQYHSPVRLTIYNLLGQEVRTLVDQSLSGGIYRSFWDGRDAGGRRSASGVYFYKLETGRFIARKRLVLLQ
jgi:hypothetical protein